MKSGKTGPGVLAAMLVSVLAACGAVGTDQDAGLSTDTDSDMGTDAGAADAGAPDAGRAWCSTLAVEDSPGADWGCADSKSCTADYLAFPDKAAQYKKPITEDALNRQLADLEAGKVAVIEEPMTPDALRDAILDNLNMRFLVDGIDERPLKVTISSTSLTDEYYEKNLLFTDPYVGAFKGILLTPRSGKPFPGVAAIHGHGDDAAVYEYGYHGTEYPGRGYVILMLTMRAMNIDEYEHEVTRALLLSGFNLMALRSYEGMLGLRYLSCLPEIDPGRLGLIGHSGGSSTGNITVRIDPRIKAYVSDHKVDWYSSDPDEPYHCETAPGIYPYHEIINDFPTSTTPVLEVPYGYITGMMPIWKFFKGHLQ